ncbi:MAG: DJ-1/PfpI family protein [Hyphomicrobiales bacterium]
MRTIGALIFPGFELLDLFGPLEMFGLLDKHYKIKLIAENIGTVASNQGPNVVADLPFQTPMQFDILFVPGGAGTRSEIENRSTLSWLRETAHNAEFVLSVCTGSALLARAGLLDDMHATTNKAAFNWVQSQGPRVKWKRQARWVEDGNTITSSGVSAGMDMSLAAIARMHDTDTAVKVANWAEYNWQQDADYDQFAALNGLV